MAPIRTCPLIKPLQGASTRCSRSPTEHEVEHHVLCSLGHLYTIRRPAASGLSYPQEWRHAVPGDNVAHEVRRCGDLTNTIGSPMIGNKRDSPVRFSSILLSRLTPLNVPCSHHRQRAHDRSRSWRQDCTARVPPRQFLRGGRAVQWAALSSTHPSPQVHARPCRSPSGLR